MGRRTMPIVGRRMLVVAVLAALLAAGVARADNNPNGMVFRAVGFFKGSGQASSGVTTCSVPTVSSAIADGAFGSHCSPSSMRPLPQLWRRLSV